MFTPRSLSNLLNIPLIELEDDARPGKKRHFGSNSHDSLEIINQGRAIVYYNLQCGDGSLYGSFSLIGEKDDHYERREQVKIVTIEDFMKICMEKMNPEEETIWRPVLESIQKANHQYDTYLRSKYKEIEQDIIKLMDHQKNEVER